MLCVVFLVGTYKECADKHFRPWHPRQPLIVLPIEQVILSPTVTCQTVGHGALRARSSCHFRRVAIAVPVLSPRTHATLALHAPPVSSPDPAPHNARRVVQGRMRLQQLEVRHRAAPALLAKAA